MKNVLLINGSPHKEGCTFTALNEIALTLSQNDIHAEIVHIGNKEVRGCIGCGGCAKEAKCVFDDTIYNLLREKLSAADGVIIGSPVYYAGPNGSLCAILDRLFYSSRGKYQNKPAAAIVSCRRGGASAAFDRLNKYFTISNMPVVSSQYWNAVHGNTPEEVKQDLEGLQIMRTLANNMAWIIRCIDKAEIQPPVREKRQGTNFIR